MNSQLKPGSLKTIDIRKLCKGEARVFNTWKLVSDGELDGQKAEELLTQSSLGDFCVTIKIVRGKRG